jgi:hypothetical protein
MNEITQTRQELLEGDYLTEKEKSLYGSICTGMDEPGCGWLHELADESLATNGVLGSLIKKGLVRSNKIVEKGEPTCYWVEAL